MKTLLVLIGLSGCGTGVLLEPKVKSPLLAGPIDCTAVCVSVWGQLVRDFGVPAAEIDCSQHEFAEAIDCEACRGAFRAKFAVDLAQCR